MKKGIILIICMAVCLSLIGGAVAVSFFKASTTGTITADSYMALTLGSSTELTGDALTMENNKDQVYNIYAQIAKSASASAEAGELVIHVTTANTEDADLSNITFGLYSDAACTSKVGAYEDLTVNGSGELTMTVSPITASTNYYLQLKVGDVTSEQLEAMEGNINIAFNRYVAPVQQG